MIIKQTHINGFGKLSDSQLNYNDGINIIYAPNEGGKSTLHSFIESMFYHVYVPGKKKRASSGVVEKYCPWGKLDYRGSMIIVDQTEYSIEKDFSTKRTAVTIFDEAKNDITAQYEQDGVFREPKFGLTHLGLSKIMFDNTISISQMRRQTGDDVVAELKTFIANIEKSNDATISVDNVKRKLADLRAEIGNARKKTSGYGKRELRLVDLEDDLKRAKQRLLEMDALIERRDQLVKDEADVNDQISEIGKTLSDIEKMEDNALLAQMDSLREQRTVERQKIERLKQYGDYSYDKITALKKLKSDVEHLEAQIDQRIYIQEDRLNHLKVCAKPSPVAHISGLLGALLIGAFMVYFGMMAFGLGTAVGLIALFSFNYTSGLKKYRAYCAERTRLKEAIADLNAGREEAVNVKMAELKRAGVNAFDQLDILYEKYRQLKEAQRELAHVEQRMRDCAAGKDIATLRYQAVQCDVSGADRQSLQQQSAKLYESLKEIIDARAALDQQLRELKGHRSAQSIEEEIAHLKAQRVADDERLKVLDIVEEKIDVAIENVQNTVMPDVNQMLSEVVNDITEGKYCDIKVNDQLDVSLLDSKVHKTVKLEALSLGTVDLLYISLRIGLADVANSGKAVPLLFDDAFVQLDDARLGGVLQFLHALNRQVLIFTCQGREKRIADQLAIPYSLINL